MTFLDRARRHPILSAVMAVTMAFVLASTDCGEPGAHPDASWMVAQ